MRPISKNFTRTTAATVFGGALLVGAGFGLASAEPAAPEPAATPDGLVTVVVGGANHLDSVPVEQAAQAVAELCGLSPEEVGTMATQVDVDGISATACAGADGEVVLAQSGTEPSPVIPGTEASTSGEATAPAPTGVDDISGDLGGAGAATPPELAEGETAPAPNNPVLDNNATLDIGQAEPEMPNNPVIDNNPARDIANQ